MTQTRSIAALAAGLALFAGCSSSSTTTAATTSASTTTAAAATTSAAGSASADASYTMAQVASHAGKSSCWTVIDKKVYDLTAWISEHPPGPDQILAVCGKDGSKDFDAQHGGDADIAQKLATFRIGTLKA